MKARKAITIVSLVLILCFGLAAVINAYNNIPIAYDGSGVNVVDLYNNPDNYDVSSPNGVADVIVKENLQKTMAANNVAAVVFDFRGYDTLGESFILLTAIAGAFVIVSKSHKKAKKEEEKE